MGLFSRPQEHRVPHCRPPESKPLSEDTGKTSIFQRNVYAYGLHSFRIATSSPWTPQGGRPCGPTDASCPPFYPGPAAPPSHEPACLRSLRPSTHRAQDTHDSCAIVQKKKNRRTLGNHSGHARGRLASRPAPGTPASAEGAPPATRTVRPARRPPYRSMADSSELTNLV